MKTTGYDLREAIKEQELRRDAASRAFNDSLKAFPDEQKEPASEGMSAFLDAEHSITLLQTAQMRYNLAVQVPVQGEAMPLGVAIKLVGGIARAEKMWRSVTAQPERYGYTEDVRTVDQIRAKATVTSKEATKNASKMAKRSAALRKAISTGNAVDVEIEGLDSSLFE